ncbi:MAG: ribonuclease III domain-containing protein [Benniella sp.]|nr:MAG: ribonuclease III domain-containing protein [Benniella sp.]
MADQNISLPHDAAELALVEAAIGYTFSNKKLLELALTAPVKRDPSPNYKRLEYLGDAVIEVVDIQAWIDQGFVKGAGQKTEFSVNNRALQAVCVDAGLQGQIRRCSKKDKKDIEALTASYATLRLSNKAYWNQGLSCKTLGDVVESVCGAVFLDSRLKLSAVEGVFRRIHWPIVEKRLA